MDELVLTGGSGPLRMSYSESGVPDAAKAEWRSLWKNFVSVLRGLAPGQSHNDQHDRCCSSLVELVSELRVDGAAAGFIDPKMRSQPRSGPAGLLYELGAQAQASTRSIPLWYVRAFILSVYRGTDLLMVPFLAPLGEAEGEARLRAIVAHRGSLADEEYGKLVTLCFGIGAVARAPQVAAELLHLGNSEQRARAYRGLAYYAERGFFGGREYGFESLAAVLGQHLESGLVVERGMAVYVSALSGAGIIEDNRWETLLNRASASTRWMHLLSLGLRVQPSPRLLELMWHTFAETDEDGDQWAAAASLAMWTDGRKRVADEAAVGSLNEKRAYLWGAALASYGSRRGAVVPAGEGVGDAFLKGVEHGKAFASGNEALHLYAEKRLGRGVPFRIPSADPL